jgi:Uma2 family endonuclease
MVISTQRLPTAEELPHSDDTPVDNELQNDIPNLLLGLLRLIWEGRSDWFFGVDMGIYYEPNLEEPAKSKVIIPDGFLAIGVPRYTTEGGRLSYLTWQEQNIMPILVLEVVSQNYNGEYEDKLITYQQLGILYYVIYNSLFEKRGRHKNRQPIAVYKLVNGKYQLQDGNPVWLPEINLGIGCELQNIREWQREWMFWYDQGGRRYLTEGERLKVAEVQNLQISQEKEQERKEKEKLAAHLRSLGINPDNITQFIP